MFIIRFFIYVFFFYLVFKAVKYLVKIFTSTIDEEKKPKVHKNPNTHLDIKKDDVIDADFEEIDNNKNDK